MVKHHRGLGLVHGLRHWSLSLCAVELFLVHGTLDATELRGWCSESPAESSQHTLSLNHFCGGVHL